DGSVTPHSKSRQTNFVKEIIIYGLLLLIVIFIVPKYIVGRSPVEGSSMQNTLYDKESVMVSKISYIVGDPERFDIVTFYPYGRDIDEYYVKRIIGLPGETVQIIGADIYINGKILKESYGKEPINDPGFAKEKITLDDDEYFVLGDNRNASTDSRFVEVGNVQRKNIDGKVFLRVWPLKSFGLVD
ncbi:MAG TPA: signal peptidase I, partial [Lachnospiraceae bacterium]|nr:signal peptidase I [Lachnospiraceae bacterium]